MPTWPGTLAVTGVVVVVPAHQEAAHLGECLRTVRSAAREVDVPVGVTVVSDASTDGTARIAREHAHVVHVDSRNVGAARRVGVREAVRRWSARRRPDLWVAGTDADTTVPADWLAEQLAHARAGAELVAGRVEVEDWDGRHHAVRAVHRASYRDGPDHGHVHGANLGLSLRLYAALGGFSPLPTGEDVDLVDRAVASGVDVHWSTSSPVLTSGRRNGRAPAGFSAHLNHLERTTTCPEHSPHTAPA